MDNILQRYMEMQFYEICKTVPKLDIIIECFAKVGDYDAEVLKRLAAKCTVSFNFEPSRKEKAYVMFNLGYSKRAIIREIKCSARDVDKYLEDVEVKPLLKPEYFDIILTFMKYYSEMFEWIHLPKEDIPRWNELQVWILYLKLLDVLEDAVKATKVIAALGSAYNIEYDRIVGTLRAVLSERSIVPGQREFIACVHRVFKSKKISKQMTQKSNRKLYAALHADNEDPSVFLVKTDMLQYKICEKVTKQLQYLKEVTL